MEGWGSPFLGKKVRQASIFGPTDAPCCHQQLTQASKPFFLSSEMAL